jgi:hypothetical protein
MHRPIPSAHHCRHVLYLLLRAILDNTISHSIGRVGMDRLIAFHLADTHPPIVTVFQDDGLATHVSAQITTSQKYS